MGSSSCMLDGKKSERSDACVCWRMIDRRHHLPLIACWIDQYGAVRPVKVDLQRSHRTEHSLVPQAESQEVCLLFEQVCSW